MTFERDKEPTSDTSYKYDVAFSFIAQDESLAIQLNDLLQDRLNTFLYSKQQEEIAGKNGEKEFGKVFGEEARIVVVLYRKGWGETPWTRIEETAIRNRSYEHGYDFAIFIPLDDPLSVPKWLPKTQLWVGLKRWGIAGAASVIEARVQELNGSLGWRLRPLPTCACTRPGSPAFSEWWPHNWLRDILPRLSAI